MAQITNKCSDEDIDYYVREAADILGVTPNVPNLGGVNTTKRILEYVLAHVVEFKKLNQDVTGYGMDSLFNSKSWKNSFKIYLFICYIIINKKYLFTYLLTT